MSSLSIKAARVERGYTQEAIAEKLGISREMFNQYENGKVVPKPMFFYALGYVLEMNPDEIRVPTKKIPNTAL